MCRLKDGIYVYTYVKRPVSVSKKDIHKDYFSLLFSLIVGSVKQALLFVRHIC